MSEITKYIDAAKKALNDVNDAELSRTLGVSRPTVSRWRAGTCAPSAEEARKLAELIGAPEGMLMAECEAARAKDDATRAAWLRVARLCSRPQETIKTAALTAVLAITLFVTGTGNVQENQRLASAALDNLHIMELRHLLRHLRAALAKAKALARTARNSWRAALAIARSTDQRAPA